MTKLASANPTAYSTTDLGFSAALVCANVSLAGMDKTSPRRVLFLFEQSDEIDQLEVDYWSGRMRVDARQHFEAIKMLKARIYA